MIQTGHPSDPGVPPAGWARDGDDQARAVRPKWVLTTSQAALLLEALPALPRTMAGLAMLTGLRRGELFALH